MNALLSVIIPAYNEEKMIYKTSHIISSILEKEKIPYEIIFVNDGSKDKTWEKIKEVSNFRIRGVNFSRNFGKESAMFAGLMKSKGDCCVIIDCDLQHPPEKIVEMYRLWLQGYEIIEGVKSDRGEESFVHRFAANCFYSIISKATSIDMSRASDFKLLDRKAVNVLLNIKEKNAFFRALSSWIGFKTRQIEFEVQQREIGESKWSTQSLIKYAITNITSFTDVPMQIVTLLGILMLISSFVLGGLSIYQRLFGKGLEGFTTVIILILFSSSIIMISLGIIGYYIAKIYEEVKGRPKYIISEECGNEISNS